VGGGKGKGGRVLVNLFSGRGRTSPEEQKRWYHWKGISSLANKKVVQKPEQKKDDPNQNLSKKIRETHLENGGCSLKEKKVTE